MLLLVQTADLRTVMHRPLSKHHMKRAFSVARSSCRLRGVRVAMSCQHLFSTCRTFQVIEAARTVASRAENLKKLDASGVCPLPLLPALLYIVPALMAFGHRHRNQGSNVVCLDRHEPARCLHWVAYICKHPLFTFALG